MAEPLILTGIKPTGRPHLGNYVGMIRPTLDMVASATSQRHFLFIANYHALNSVDDAAELRELTYDVAATLLACGLDPERTHFYRQSDIPEIFELTTILAAVTPKGLIDRAHAYKAAVDRNRELGKDVDDGVNMGLYTYPILMTADILLFNADAVPVGKDQVQHVEFARDIAGYFNRKYDCEVMRLPKAVIQENAAAIPGLDGRKMSKSYDNAIPIFGDPAEVTKLVKRIVTDSKRPEEPKDPDASSLFQIYQALAPSEEARTMRERFAKGGVGYGDLKNRLIERVNTAFEKPRKIYNELMADPSKIEQILQKSAASVRPIAAARIEAVRRAIGAK